MIRWAERDAGFTFHISQGSFNRGGVSASAGTHDGSAVDFGMNGYSVARRRKAMRSLKRAGFGAWFRTPAQGFTPHIHAIPFGDPDVSPAARDQLHAYDRGRDGLARNNSDPNPWRPGTLRTFGFLLRRPRIRKPRR